MVADFTCKLNKDELNKYLSCYVSIERLNENFIGRSIDDHGLKLPNNYDYTTGSKLGSETDGYNEIIINKRKPHLILEPELRIKVNFDCDGNEIDSISVDNKQVDLNTSYKNLSCNPYVNGVRVNKYSRSRCIIAPSYLRNGTFLTGRILKKNLPRRILNGTYMTSESTEYKENIDNNDVIVNNKRKLSSENETAEKLEDTSQQNEKEPRRRKQKMSPEPMKDEPIIEESLEPLIESESTPIIIKRKRGRPRKNNPDPPFNPTTPSKKKTYYTPVKKPVNNTGEIKRKRGRPRKVVEFGFHSIVSEIKTISLPSDLWSGHVSVTSKRSQVCFTRIVQPVDDNIPVELDRSVKFNGSLQYFIKINNRNTELIGAPKEIKSLKDIEILLQIVNDIDITDTAVLRYININNIPRNNNR